jgi:hypothetical protein
MMFSRSRISLETLILVICLLLQSCAPKGTATPTTWHSLDFLCQDQVPDCKNLFGRKAFLGFTTNTIANCSLILKSAGIATLYQSFNYSSQTDVLNDGADAVWGRFQSYFDSEGNPAPELESGFYRACGFIDVNSNGFLDSGEPFMEESWNPNSDLHRIFSDWSPAP